MTKTSNHKRERRRCLARCLLAVLVVAGGLSGCTGVGRVSRENDRLRRANLDLRRQVNDLEEAVRLRVAQIELMQQRAGNSARVAGADLVQLTELRFGRYGGAIDTDHDGIDDELRVYLSPVDQHGRFMVVAGSARLQAVAIVPGQEPRIVLEHTFSPAEFDGAYRSGLMGTHYTLARPLPGALSADLTDLTVKVAFTDAASGVELSHERTYRLQTAPTAIK